MKKILNFYWSDLTWDEVKLRGLEACLLLVIQERTGEEPEPGSVSIRENRGVETRDLAGAIERFEEDEIHKRTGKAVRTGGHKGAKLSHADKASKWADYQRAVDSLMVSNRKISYTEACRRIAKQKGVSEKTVRTHTEKKAG